MEFDDSNNSLQNDSEPFGNMPKGSEEFGTVPQSSESFRTLPNVSERKESHTLTVREAARMFEVAGVARTERSILNWCQPNKDGIARLDSYFDPNERKYFITPQSAELAIKEEQAKAARPSELNGSFAALETLPNTSERISATTRKNSDDTTTPSNSESLDSELPKRIKALEQEVLDLKITNKAKDYFIDELKSERQTLVQEQRSYVERLMTFSRQIGELKTKLLRLGQGQAPSFPKEDDHPLADSDKDSLPEAG